MAEFYPQAGHLYAAARQAYDAAVQVSGGGGYVDAGAGHLYASGVQAYDAAGRLYGGAGH